MKNLQTILPWYDFLTHSCEGYWRHYCFLALSCVIGVSEKYTVMVACPAAASDGET